MHKHRTTGRLRMVFGIAAFTAAGVAAASVAATTATTPAVAADSPPNLTTGPMNYQCYQNSTHDSEVRYLLTSVYVDEWDLAPDSSGTPVVNQGLRYRYHVSKQNLEGSTYFIEYDKEGFWGGPTQYVPISDSYSLPSMVCKNLTGFEFGIRTD